ncbi:hypothetical protein A9302_19040 [Salmonella enterica]|nr:hypothetical protein [Salmonella enterica]
MRCGGASVVLSEQPPACAGYPPDRPDPPRYRFMFSLWVKWPEKAVSESSHALAKLNCLAQVEKAACVTFPLCAVKVTHRAGAVLKHGVSGAVLRSRGSKCLAANAGRSPSGKGR